MVSLVCDRCEREWCPFWRGNTKRALLELRSGDGGNELIYRLLVLLIAVSLGGCSLLPGGTVVDSALVVHTAGSARSTVSARVPVPAAQVYAAFADILDDNPEIEVVSRKDSAMLIEVVGEDFGEITAQVTSLGSQESLLYVWADTTGTNRTGAEVAGLAVEAVCDELGVDFERVDY